ncbi:MAG TPA: VWA domain-containing protein [Blastocatellia bacterium]|nr:VWA domain-containing protein [Blastocatellia bacterium]
MNKLVGLILAVLVCPNAGAPQTTPPVQEPGVRLKTELVHIHAVVSDKRGKLIEGLKKDDFELLEQGRQREISFFSEERVSAKATAHPLADISPTEAVTSDAGRPPDPARSIVLFVDTLHLSSVNLIRARQALKRFVDERMTDRDVVLIVTSTGESSGFEQFTQDRQLLHYLIDKIRPWQGSRESRFTPYLASMVRHGDPTAASVGAQVLQGEEGMMLDGLPPNVVRQMVEAKARDVLVQADYKRKALLSVLKAVAERLAGLPGQRLIMFLSDGFSMMSGQGGSDLGELQSVISKAARAGVLIYSFDVKGLRPPAEFDASLPVGGNPATLGSLSSYMSASDKELQDGMNALARDTGGMPFFNTNDLKGSLQKAVDDNRVYYVLAYYPEDVKEGKMFRRINLRVKNHPEYLVRTQSGYLASDLTKSDETKKGWSPQRRLFDAIAGPLPTTAINVAAAASFLELGSDNAQVSLEAWIDGARLGYREQGRRVQLDLEIATVVYDRFGQPVSTQTKTVHGSVAGDEIALVKRVGFRYGTRIEVKPGRYQVRLGVRDAGTGNIGTAMAWVEVPGPSKGKMALSNILLSENQSLAADRLTAASAKLNPWLGIRYYNRGALLVYYCMIYNAPAGDGGGGLTMQSEISKGGELVYKSPPHSVASRVIGKDRKGIAVGGQIPLALEPGIYELRLVVTDSKAKQTAQREVTFGVGG